MENFQTFNFVLKASLRCQGVIFELEKVQAKKQVLHRNCLSCMKCKKPLLPSNFFDGPDGELYCQLCYASLFGHKRAKSVGPSNTSSIKPGPGDASCLLCGFTVFEAEKVAVRNGCYHVSCYKCSSCNSLLDSSSANSGGGGRMLCNGCFVKIRRREAPGDFVKSHVDTVSIAASEDDPDMCVRCWGKVQ